MTQSINIAIADDHKLFRSGIKALIESIDNYRVSHEASSGLEFVTQLNSSKVLPDLCIIDMNMKPLNGYETIKVIKKKWPDLKVITLSMYDHELLIRRLLNEGACSYLCKGFETDIFFEAISQVIKKGYYHTEAILKIAFQKTNNKKAYLEITDKELQYLCYNCTDLTNKEIARRMGVETRTIDNYSSLFSKLDIHTKTGLAIFATKNGLDNLSTDYLLNNKVLGMMIK